MAINKKYPDQCHVYTNDPDKVQRLKGILVEGEGRSAASIFKALADETRVKIAYALCLEEELCVHDVAHVIGASVAVASHHLRLLRNMGLAKYRKEGKLVFYSLDDDHVKELILVALEHGRELIQHGAERNQA